MEKERRINMIRAYCEEDADALLNIWLSVNLKAHYFIEGCYWTDNFQAVKEKYLPQSETYVYEIDGKIAGFVSILPSAYIGALFVASELQGKGIGTALINHCKQHYNRLTLSVYTQNEQAVQFYKNAGFHIVREQEGDCKPHTVYLMRWVSSEKTAKPS